MPLTLSGASIKLVGMKAAEFEFLDVAARVTLVDHELELVEPAARHMKDVIAACHHPLTREHMPAQAQTTMESLGTFLSHNPRGRTAGDPARDVSPGYTFWLRVRAVAPLYPHMPLPETVIAGSISLRIGQSSNLELYLGHIGYHVLPPARGHRYAERACRLVLPIARAHGQTFLWITCNPDNLASRRTVERLGAKYVNTVAVPRENPLFSQGDRQKARYRLEL